MRNNILIIYAEDWAVCYVDEVSYDQAHSLGEGSGFLGFLKELDKKFDFRINEIKECSVKEVDLEYLESHGRFPNNISDLKGDYERQ